MAGVLIDESIMKGLAGLLREKNGSTDKYYPAQMEPAFRTLLEAGGDSGAGNAPVLAVLEITENGVYLPGDGIVGFSKVIVNIASNAPGGRYLTLEDIVTNIGASGLAVDSEGTISMKGASTWTVLKLAPAITTVTGKRSSAKLWIAYKDNGDGTYNCLEPGNLWRLTAGSTAATKFGTCSVKDAAVGSEITIALADGALTITDASGGIVVSVTDANMIGFWASSSGNTTAAPIYNMRVL